MSDVTAADFDAIAAKYATRIDKLQGKVLSDTVDEKGHQYIDLVMEGGGTLGVALLGYAYVLEQVGLRFLGIAGTSAGAVSAVALAAAGSPGERRVTRLLDKLANIPMDTFVDGKDNDDTDARDAVDAWLQHRNVFVKAMEGMQVIDNIKAIHGLNRGDVFLKWMKDMLAGLNEGQPVTVAALRTLMNNAPKLMLRDTVCPSDFEHLAEPPFTVKDGRRELVCKETELLCVISADIATESKVELPGMAGLFWEHPEQLDVSELARASMSIPGFFAPCWVDRLDLPLALERWKAFKPGLIARKGHEEHFLPRRHCLVDGGVLSNFPINVFHTEHRVPLRPTFGVKLQWDETSFEVEDVIDIFVQCFNSARHALDIDFIARNPDFNKLVSYIDTGNISWLDFHMDAQTKKKLFEIGVTTALDFLEGFDWEGYKGIRRKHLGL